MRIATLKPSITWKYSEKREKQQLAENQKNAKTEI